jgi:hypothetical protein
LTEQAKANKDQTPASVAAPADNAKLEHTEGGVTTRDDLLDAGVPMTQGKPDERVGPEDALGTEPTRGDYSGRIDSGPHLASVPLDPNEAGDRVRYVNAATGKPAKEGDDDAIAVPNERPTAKIVEQTPAP